MTSEAARRVRIMQHVGLRPTPRPSAAAKPPAPRPSTPHHLTNRWPPSTAAKPPIKAGKVTKRPTPKTNPH